MCLYPICLPIPLSSYLRRGCKKCSCRFVSFCISYRVRRRFLDNMDNVHRIAFYEISLVVTRCASYASPIRYYRSRLRNLYLLFRILTPRKVVLASRRRRDFGFAQSLVSKFGGEDVFVRMLRRASRFYAAHGLTPAIQGHP